MRARLGGTPLVALTVELAVALPSAYPASAAPARTTAPAGPAAGTPDGPAGHVVGLEDGASPRANVSALAAHARLRYRSAPNGLADRLAADRLAADRLAADRLAADRSDPAVARVVRDDHLTTATHDNTGGITPRATHTELVGRVGPGINVDTHDPYPGSDGHGTPVAATIGGSRYGVAKAVTVVPVRVLDCDGGGTLAGVDWVDWVTAHHGGPSVANPSPATAAGADTAVLEEAAQASGAAGVGYVGRPRRPRPLPHPQNHALTTSRAATRPDTTRPDTTRPDTTRPDQKDHR